MKLRKETYQLVNLIIIVLYKNVGLNKNKYEKKDIIF